MYCIGFDMAEPEKAWEHMELERIEAYGEEAYGHLLHLWDEGGRTLFRCKSCGGYCLCQRSEYHSFTGEDREYQDYFPVDSLEEAQELNRKYGAAEIELCFPKRYLKITQGKPSWSRPSGGRQAPQAGA